MKKILLGTTILISLLFVSCSSDDDNNNQINASIVGTWAETADNGCDQPNTITFSSNGNVSITFEDNGVCNFSTDDELSYVLDGSVLTLTIPDEHENGGDYIVDYNILTLNETTLIIQDFRDNEVGEYAPDERETTEYERL